MIFIFDENISPRIADALNCLGENVTHIAKEFGQGIPDEVWIPQIAEKGYILVTNDYRILKKPQEAKSIKENGVSVFFIDITTHPDLWGWVEFIVNRWRKFKELASERQRPFAFRVTQRSIKDL